MKLYSIRDWKDYFESEKWGEWFHLSADDIEWLSSLTSLEFELPLTEVK